MRKIISVFLCALLLMSMVLPVLAQGETVTVATAEELLTLRKIAGWIAIAKA